MRRTQFLAAMLLVAWAGSASAGTEIKVLSPGSTEAAFKELLPQFEEASGSTVKIGYGPAGALAKRVANGEAADAAILGEAQIDALQKQGRFVAGSAAVLIKVGIGVFVRKGDPKPDISTVNAFIASLSRARTIAYADPKLGGSASILVDDMLKSLDITGSIGGRTKLVPPAKPLLNLVAAGGIDFGFNPIPEILSDPRVELVGPLPAQIQRYTRYTAALVTGSNQADGYKALLAFLSAPSAVAVLKTRGFEAP